MGEVPPEMVDLPFRLPFEVLWRSMAASSACCARPRLGVLQSGTAMVLVAGGERGPPRRRLQRSGGGEQPHLPRRQVQCGRTHLPIVQSDGLLCDNWIFNHVC
jgi:hypothetical protein